MASLVTNFKEVVSKHVMPEAEAPHVIITVVAEDVIVEVLDNAVQAISVEVD